MTAILTSYASKPVMKDSAVQVTVNHLPDIRTIKAILPFKPVFLNLLEGLKIVLVLAIYLDRVTQALAKALQVDNPK